VAFLAGLGVFIVAFAVNYFNGLFMRNVQKQVMKSKDARMKVSTEAINNIKMIKLYSW
jgi:ABC-type bacteriocin/lantibiotic exporter with double-glycine peptidase domain